jgi:hypothetical protein
MTDAPGSGDCRRCGNIVCYGMSIYSRYLERELSPEKSH